MIRIRLQRKGRKKRPIYHLVVADSRAARDGRIIEQVGRYDNVTESKEVVLNEDRILYWLETGAQPSDTVRKILRNSGLLYKRHLIMWGKTEEEIEAAMAEWKSYRDSKDGGDTSRKDTHKSVLDAEEKKFKKQAEQDAADAAKEVAAKKAKDEELSKGVAAPVVEKVVEIAEETVTEPVAEEPAKVEVAEVAKEEEPKVEKPEAVADVKEEKADEPVAEEPAKAEVVEETKKEEPKVEKPEAAAEVKEEKAADASQTSAEMTAKDAIDYIKNTDLADLEGFITSDETRVTVLSAWESKQSDN